MINLEEAVYTDQWNNDAAGEKELYFNLSEKTARSLAYGQFKEQYEKIVADYCKSFDGEPVFPHMEAQLACPYDGDFYEDGFVGLGIGVTTKKETSVLEIMPLEPGKDYSKEEAKKMWENIFVGGNEIEK